eukprot:jgi/Picre1/29593/NNA_004978.t1
MLGSVKEDGEWAVLLLDKFTTRIMSNICGISDLLDYGVSLVENLMQGNSQGRYSGQGIGVYFVTPTDENVNAIVSMNSKRSCFQKVHIFFSTAPSPQHIERIKRSSQLLSRLCPEDALVTLLGAGAEMVQPRYDDALSIISQRLASLFVTMKEMPSIRYRAAVPQGDEFPHGLDSRLLATQRVAIELSNHLNHFQQLNHVPECETCELIILDRGFDAVAPVIHEWTYESMIQDVLESNGTLTQGRVFRCEVVSEAGVSEEKEHVLDERDSLYMELRHKHFADASTRITNYLDELMRGGKMSSMSVRNMDLRSMAKLVQKLPKYQDDLRTLNTHVEIASRLNKDIDAGRLAEFGTLEQEIVCGDATSKELISFLSSNQLLDRFDKLRLLLCYSATHLEKLDEVREAQWRKLARLQEKDMKCITNLEYLGLPVCKRNKGALSGISFGRKKKKVTRRDRNVFGINNQDYTLARFVPLLAEKLEELISGRMSEEQYPFVQAPRSPSVSNISFSDTTSSRDGSQVKECKGAVTSFRTLRSNSTWVGKATNNSSNNNQNTRSDHSDEKGRQNSGGKVASGQGRLFIYILGGFTYSELRVVHHLSSKLDKDIFIGGTSMLNPRSFIDDLSNLS